MTDRESDASNQSFAERLLDESSDALILLSADGRLQSWNLGAEVMFGYSAKEALGQVMEDLIVPLDEIAGARQALADVGHERTVLVDTVRRHKDGSLIRVDVSMRRAGTADGATFVAVTKKEQRMQEAGRLKSEFLANMSHELRTPLNSIIGFADLMHRGKVGPVSADHKEYLGDILTSSKHLLQLINDVLDLAKVESGKMDFRSEPVDMAKLAGEVRDILRGLAASKRLRLEILVDPQVSAVVVDPVRVKQILYNYLSNAIKFTPEQGSITVRVAPEGPGLFRMDVEDTGVGIQAENLGKLFVEFQQLDATVAKKYQGTGLGLALTKRLAEAHGGRVLVESTPGRGSTFSVILPRSTPQAPPDPLRPGAASRRQTDSGTILVVDDDGKALKLAEATVREVGYRCIARPNAEEALAAFEVDAPALVIVDLIMPGVDGFQFVARLRATATGRKVPIVVWTVKDVDDSDRRRLEPFGVCYVAKGGRGLQALGGELRRILALNAEEPEVQGA